MVAVHRRGGIHICGIVGILLLEDVYVGRLLVRMMSALQHRGTDSAGVAIYSEAPSNENEYKLCMFTKSTIGTASKIYTAITRAGGNIRSTHVNPVNGHGFDEYLIKAEQDDLKRIIESVDSTEVANVISLGRSLKIIKDVCMVKELDKRFKVSGLEGSHGLGHVRFSTESHVDLLHAHPFQTFDYPDIAVVHNGQITNYYKMREKLERKERSFETENDSELIVHFISDKLEQGFSLKEAMVESVKDLDGPFSYIISTPEALGVARDKLGLRPAMILKNEKLYAVASEESALRVLGQSGSIRNLKPGEVITWQK